MSNSIIKKVIIGLVVVVLLLPVIGEMIENSKLPEIAYKDFQEKVDNTKEYNFALFYIGKDNKEYKNTIKGLIGKNKPVDKTSSTAYFINVDNLSSEDAVELLGESSVSDAYIFVSNKKITKIVKEKLDDKKLDAYIKEFVSLGVDESIKAYKIPDTAEDYIAAMNSDKVTMAVFGRDTCFYCNKFKIMYNTIAEEYGVDVYYFSSESNKSNINSKAYPSAEYKKLMALDNVTVPSSCSKTRKDAKLSEGFSTPFSIFTKNGEVLDTLCGYYDKDDLLKKMQEVGMITE